MRIWILERKDSVGYDEYNSKVIAAMNETRAREIANEYVGDEGHVWDSKDLVSCEEINLREIQEGLILADFNAG